MATILGDLAHLIRSKNAGSFILPSDIRFDEEATYRRMLASGVLTREAFARIYWVLEEKVMLFAHDTARATKIPIPRPTVHPISTTATRMAASSTRRW